MPMFNWGYQASAALAADAAANPSAYPAPVKAACPYCAWVLLAVVVVAAWRFGGGR